MVTQKVKIQQKKQMIFQKKDEKMLSPKSLKIKIQKEEMKKNFSLKLKSEVESKK